MARLALFLIVLGVALPARAVDPVVAERPAVPQTPAPADRVLVEIVEDLPPNKAWPVSWPPVAESYAQDSFGFTALRKKYDARAVQIDRSRAFGVRASSL